MRQGSRKTSIHFSFPFGSLSSFQAGQFWLSCLSSALQLKQEISRYKEGHWVMNIEVSQDSILGQILESKQMLIISKDGLEHVFL